MTKGYKVLSLETAKSKPTKATVTGFDIDTEAQRAKEAQLAFHINMKKSNETTKYP